MPNQPPPPAQSGRILIVDDDPVVRRLLRHTLEKAGYQVLEAGDGREALELVDDEVSVVLLDLQMPIMNGQTCQQRLHQDYPSVQVIIVTIVNEVREAVEAMKRGAFEYITKPFDPEHLVELVGRAVHTNRLTDENRHLRQAMLAPWPQGPFVGGSPAAQEVIERVRKVAALHSTVMIQGESGSGKGLVARMIHNNSPRAQGPFVTVNCTALPRDLVESELFGHERGAFTGATDRRIGRVEMANGGTLFLDEIGDMPMELQPKLLTFLQERIFQRVGGNRDISVDVRVIAATHQDLFELSRQKLFREDLYFRLNVLPLMIPPLRERMGDMKELAEFTLQRIAARRKLSGYELTAAALKTLQSYHWTGNVRELENVLERASAFCEGELIDQDDLPSELAGGAEASEPESVMMTLAGLALAEVERLAIEQTLDHCEGNKAQAARILCISEKSIYNKMKRLEIKSPKPTVSMGKH